MADQQEDKVPIKINVTQFLNEPKAEVVERENQETPSPTNLHSTSVRVGLLSNEEKISDAV